MRYYKPLLWLSFLVAASLLTLSCDEQPNEDEPNFQENLSSFNSTITKLDSTLNLMDKLQQEVSKIEEDRAMGKITDEEALEKLNALENTLGRKIAKSSNFHPVKEMPGWALNLGLTEPTGMNFDQDFSEMTSEYNDTEGYNSMVMVYKGDYNTAMAQASKIAHKAGVPISQDYKDAMELSEKYGIEAIKGALYANFEIGADDNPKYNISISVDEDGSLTITATDRKKMIEALSNDYN